MARKQDIRLRRSATAGAVPTTTQLNLGELAINTYDGKLFLKKDVSGTETVVEIGGDSGTQQTAVYKEYVYTATNNQTSFSGSDDNSQTLSYVVGYLQVFLNGVLLENGTDYAATTGNSVVLVNGAATSDILQISTFVKVLGTGDMVTNTFTGNGSTAAYTLTANPDTEENTIVFVDGVYQEKDTYTVSGTTLTFDANVPNGASIEVVIGSRNVTLSDVNDLTISGALTVEGNTTLGNAATDTVTFTADIASNLIPSADSTYNIGASGTEWANVYADTFTGNLTGNVTGNLTGNVTGTVSSIANHDTDDLTEGSSNLYYTDARVDSRLASGSLATISTSGNVTVGGNLTVEGTTTTLNTATLDVEDKNITLNYGSGDTSSSADGAGITIQDAVNSSTDATILWDGTNDEFDFSHNISAPGLLNGAANSFLYLSGGNASNAGSNILLYGQSHASDANATVFRAGGTETMRITSSGNVGIGTSSPSNPLHVYHATTDTVANFESGDTAVAVNFTASDNSMQIATSNTDGIIKNNGAGNFRLFNNGSERIRIDSNGRLGVGTTAPDVPFHVEGGENILARLESTHTNGNARILFKPTGNNGWNIGANDNGSFTIYDVVGGANSFQIETGASASTLVVDSNSRVGIGTNSPGVSLDVGTLTDAIRVPNGTTAQRPTAALGQLRYNTTTSEFEGYAAGAWGKIGGGGDSFGTIAVSGQSNVVAEQENDTLTLVGTNGVSITTDASSDTVTIDGRTSYSPFTTDLFTTANATTTDFVLSVTPSSEDNLIVFLEGVYQNKNSYTLSSSTLTLDSAPASGEEVVVHIVSDLISGQALVRNNFTGDGSTTAFTLTLAPMNENNTFVYMDGVYQEKSEYSVSGTTLTFGAAPANGDSIEVIIPKTTELQQPAVGSIDDATMYDTTVLIPQTVTATTVASTSATTIATHAAATYRTIKYLVQCTQGTDYHSTEINLIHDGTTVYITEYGTLFDNASLGTFNATISGGNILLQITPGSATSMAVKVVSSAIPV